MLRRRVLAFTIGLAALAPPAVASSGGPVAYTTYTDRATLATVNPDGTDNRVLVAGSDPAWSPHGRWLAYSRDYTEIWRVRADGSHAQRMVGMRDRAMREPSWSPDGRRIAFTVTWWTGTGDENEVQHSAVYVANRDGSGRRLVRRDASRPAWSPDGRRIAIEAAAGVVVLTPDGRFAAVHRIRESLA